VECATDGRSSASRRFRPFGELADQIDRLSGIEPRGNSFDLIEFSGSGCDDISRSTLTNEALCLMAGGR
jgi:hypothetical protein